jgi:AcrR family transcriptional regulator
MSKRDDVLDAALQLFEERTYGAGTIYRYFPSKEALANAIYRDGKEQMCRYLVDGIPAGLDPRVEFGHWWRQLFAFACDHPTAFAFLEIHHHAPYLDAESKAAGAPVDIAALQLVARAQAAGVVREAPAEELLAMVFGAFVGLVRGARDGFFALDDALCTRTEETIWGLLAP